MGAAVGKARHVGSARLVHNGAGNFPSARDRVDKARALGEEGQLVDVVDAENLAPVEIARTLVILDVEGVADQTVIEFRGANVDRVRIRVIDFAAQAILVLRAQTGLEAVVVAVGGGFLLLNVLIARIGKPCVDAAVAVPAAITWFTAVTARARLGA